MQAFAAAGFHKAGQSKLIEHRLDQLRSLLHLRPANPLAGIQVKGHSIGFADGAGRGVPGVELNHVELRGGQQGLRRSNFQQRRMAGVESRVKQFDAGDGRGFGMLLEEKLAGDAGRSAHQGRRPGLEVRQHEGRDTCVIVDQVFFCETR